MSRKRTKIWKTRDGKKIRVCDMDDAHLGNTIAFLERWAEWCQRIRLREALDLANGVTADMASYYAERDLDLALQADWEDYVPEIYHDMVDELRDRNATVSV